jgi:hypothetical protein
MLVPILMNRNQHQTGSSLSSVNGRAVKPVRPSIIPLCAIGLTRSIVIVYRAE